MNFLDGYNSIDSRQANVDECKSDSAHNQMLEKRFGQEADTWIGHKWGCRDAGCTGCSAEGKAIAFKTFTVCGECGEQGSV